MARNAAYREAERKIEAARRSGAKKLVLTGRDVPNIRLSELPESLGQLTQLQELDISTNELTELPDSLGQLTQLRDLRFYENDLATLPDSVRNLTRLSHLVLMGNHRLHIPPEIVNDWESGAQRILDTISVLALIESFLKQGIMEGMGRIEPEERAEGTPQGGVICFGPPHGPHPCGAAYGWLPRPSVARCWRTSTSTHSTT